MERKITFGKKRLLLIVYNLLFLGEGLIKFDAVLIASLVDTLYINKCRFTSCIIGRLATAASLANITVVWC